jgi:CxxC motif-containing protein
MEGNQCPKAEEFIAQELIEPMRTLTSTVRISGAKWDMLPVRTDKPIPRRLFFEVMRELAAAELQAPVHVGDVIIKDFQGTGANVIATRNMLRESPRAA